MKVLIAAASFSPNLSGLPRHAFNVARSLLQRPDISAVHLVIAPWQRCIAQAERFDADSRLTTHVADMKPTSLSRNLWYYRRLPKLAATLRVDVAHMTFPVPINSGAFTCPTVATLHDLYPYEIPDNFRFPQIVFNRLILRQCLRNADAIACVSEITKLRLKEYGLDDAWQKAIRIYNCVAPASLHNITAPIPSWRGEAFLFCVAQHRRNKNIPLLIEVFHRLLCIGQINPEMKLVVVGIPGPETSRIHALVSEYGLGERIHLLEGLSQAELHWCYARCEALVAPSITEGFGLPVAEALLSGCRVVCSDIPAFREVGGEYCRFVDLSKDAEEALGGAIVAALKDPRRRPVALPQFSAPVIAEQYIDLYRRLIAHAALKRSDRFSAAIHAAASERHSL
jgi:glycosyltransferase involved in cell wall biosynthesis